MAILSNSSVPFSGNVVATVTATGGNALTTQYNDAFANYYPMYDSNVIGSMYRHRRIQLSIVQLVLGMKSQIAVQI